MKVIHTDKAPAAIGPYSQGIVVGDLLFTSGQVPLDPVNGNVCGTEIVEQATRALENLQAIVREAGADLNKVVKTTCFVADMVDFAAFNQVYARFFGDHKPARSCVAVKQLPKGVLVEVEAIVYLG